MAGEFEVFARRELPGLLRYALMLTGDPALAEDLAQDVLLKAHRHWARVSAAEHPRSYLRTMLTNEFLSWRRRWSVRHVGLTHSGDVEQAVVADHAATLADRGDLWERMARLPRRQRAVLVLRYYEQLTDSEIAATLGCSAGTVRGYASRALATLRVELGEAQRLEEESR